MATLAIVPVEEYHSRMQSLTSAVLVGREQERGFSTFTEQRVQVNDDPRYRIPDVCVKALPHEPAPVLVKPDLVIEIVSPDDTITEMLATIGEYMTAGIPYIWVIDPYQRAVVEVESEGIRIRRCASGVAQTDLVGAVDFNALFARLG